MLSDLRFALRQIAKSPGYATVVVLTLAFGLAVNSTIFGMINAFLLKPLNVPEADRVVPILQRNEAWHAPHQISFPDFKDYRERLTTLRDLWAFLPQPAHLSAEGRSPERAWLEVVTPNAFQALGIPAQLGRTLLPGDGEALGGRAIVVLSHACWQQRFGADPAIVGQTIVLNGHPFEVVGVAPDKFNGFSGTIASSAFVPTSALNALLPSSAGMLEWRGATAWLTYGRLAPGASVAEAQAEAAVITAQLVEQFPAEHRGVSSVVLPERLARPHPIFSDYLPGMMVMFAAMVTLVLLIACANVANLMFARMSARQREFAMRAALGAGRLRLIRQLLVESVLLAIVAGALSGVLGAWAAPMLEQFAPKGDTPVAFETDPNWRDYAFTVIASLVAGIASGLWPAWRASRMDLNESLKMAAGGRVSGGRHWMRNALVVGQVTFSLVVLASAGLFLHALQQVREIDPGFRPQNLLFASFNLQLQDYDAARAHVFQERVVERVRALPGVQSAALTTHVPFDYYSNMRDVRPENPPPALQDGAISSGFALVSPGFMDVMGLRLRRGRQLDATDTPETPRVAVVNQALVDQCWPGEDGLGKRFQPWRDGPWIEVVGVAETAKYIMLTEAPRQFYYAALTQDFTAPAMIMVRTSVRPESLGSAVRQAVHEIDPHLPVYDVRTLDELMGNSVFAYMPMRMGAILAGTQGAIGLLLAVMGLYAVVSFGVTQRTREIGVRIALGAQPGDVIRSMLRQGLVLTLVGLTIGAVLAVGVGFILAQTVYGLSPLEPWVILGVTALLLATAVLACWLPARRAAKVDPMIALRAE